MKIESLVICEEREVTLTAYLQDGSGEFGFENRPAILVLPGGGYGMCSDRESEPVALAYMQAGYQAFVLRYTLKQKGAWPLPLQDYERAVELIEENSEKWNVVPNKMAVVGFSAGGHLAACAATMAQKRPNAAILVYPAVEQEILDTCCQEGLPNPSEHVDEYTSPCFVVAARDDNIVPIQSSLYMQLALANAGITFESHIYSYGGHGFSVGTRNLNAGAYCDRIPNWVGDSIGWLKEVLGEFCSMGMTEPLYEALIDGDKDKMLSIRCTLGHIRKQSEEVQKELAVLYNGLRAFVDMKGFDYEKFCLTVHTMTIKELLMALKVSGDVIEQLDRNLREFANE